jgi:SAM-dependent methyltransferase
MMKESIRKNVRERYARVAKEQQSCCDPTSSCCGLSNSAKSIAEKIGYSEGDLASAPEGANLGLGCGNPIALASLKLGETVVDLGSGPGFDCFLASRRVGAEGKVIGIDMTPEMLVKARENAQKGGFTNVEFRLGEIEHLPVADNSIDVIISNCVINLSTDKLQVFREAFRVLKRGGRLMISDTVLLKPLPEYIQQSVTAYVGCVSGAMQKQEYINTVREAGFQNVQILKETPFSEKGIMSFGERGSSTTSMRSAVSSKGEKGEGSIRPHSARNGPLHQIDLVHVLHVRQKIAVRRVRAIRRDQRRGPGIRVHNPLDHVADHRARVAQPVVPHGHIRHPRPADQRRG